MFKKTSLAKDFQNFSLIILAIVVIFSATLGVLIFRSNYIQQNIVLAESGQKLGRQLKEYCNFVQNYFDLLNNKISVSKVEDPAKISRYYFNDILDDKLTGEEVIGNFKWITSDRKIIQNDKSELSKGFNLFDADSYSHLSEVQLSPNYMKFSAPLLDPITKKWVIPIGYGVVKNNNFFGSIFTTISIENFRIALDFLIDSKDIGFIILDNNFNFILASKNISYKSEGNRSIPKLFIDKFESEINNSINYPDFFNKKVNFAGFDFKYFYRSKYCPFYIIVGQNAELVSDRYWQTIVSRVFELSLMSIIFIVLLYYFRRQIVKPILRLADGAKRIAHDECNVTFDWAKEYDEVGLLASQLSEIQETKLQLIQAKNQVEKVNNDLENKVIERTRALNEALLIKTEFLNCISHEVRTPIHGVHAIAVGLVENWDIYDDPKKLVLANEIARNSHRLFSLISNILNASLFNENRFECYFQKCNFIEIIRQIIFESEILFLKDKDIKIILDAPRELIVEIDREKIAQVIRNLVNNSIKFTNQGEVKILVECPYLKNDLIFLKFSIIDQGVVLRAEQVNDFFSSFTQNNNLNGGKNFGLGLYVSSQIIEAHGGELSIIRDKEHELKISFTLPIKNLNLNIEQQANQEHISFAAQELDPKNVLIIDDEITCQISMEMLLSKTRFKLFYASDGNGAINFLQNKAHNIDLIFLDLMMPGINGIALLEKFKADPEFVKIPVIIQSGTNDDNEINQCLSLGACAVVRKPYEKNQIIALLNKFLK